VPALETKRAIEERRPGSPGVAVDNEEIASSPTEATYRVVFRVTTLASGGDQVAAVLKP
jgi:CMP-2-keto-3-deoxyoctulosonic acid synthetase